MIGKRSVPRKITVLAVLALLVFAAPDQPATAEVHEAGTAPEVQEFGDWSVSCDNTRRCEAISESKARERFKESEWGEAAMLHLRVVRDAGPNTLPTVYVDRRTWGEGPSSPTKTPTLHVYYGGETDRAGRAYRLLPLVDGKHQVDPRDVAAFLAESIQSDSAVTFMRGSSDIHGAASTKGMTAALRFIDEAQGRRDTVTAIYARGRLPSARVFPPKPLPQVTPIKGARRSTSRPVRDDELRQKGLLICGVAAAPHTGAVHALANGDRLWRVDCGEEAQGSARGPLNVWFVEKPGGNRIFADLPRPEQGRSALRPVLPNSSFDPVSGLLTATMHYSAHGDCGWRRQWGWNGHEWQLVSGRELHACMGILPDGWLTTWRSSVRP